MLLNKIQSKSIPLGASLVAVALFGRFPESCPWSVVFRSKTLHHSRALGSSDWDSGFWTSHSRRPTSHKFLEPVLLIKISFLPCNISLYLVLSVISSWYFTDLGPLFIRCMYGWAENLEISFQLVQKYSIHKKHKNVFLLFL